MMAMNQAMQTQIELNDLAAFYRRELLENILPFWVKYAPDTEAGGYYTCLNRDGAVYDDSKPCMWAQGRIAWTLAHLYNELERRPEWLAAARAGIDFMLKHGFTPEGRMYYSLTRAGAPLEASADIYTELSAVLALTEYARATADEKLRRIARELFEVCWRFVAEADNRQRNGGWDPRTFKMRRHGHAMIVLNVLQQLRLFREEPADRPRVDECIKYMLQFHQKPDRRLVLEVVGWEDGAPAPGWMGRWANPGHMIEGGIFLIHEAWHRRDQTLKNAGLDWIRWGFELGWDKEYGGIFNDVDAAGLPMPGAEALVADSKLWWQHAEALYGLLLAYRESGDAWFLEAYRQTHAYSFEHFADPEYGEWYALLDRAGRPVNRAKGTSRKNCFHIGRNFYWAMRLMQKMTP